MAHRTSAAAWHAANVVFRLYDVELLEVAKRRPGVTDIPGLRADAKSVAVMIDYVSGVYAVAALRPELRYWMERLFYGTATAPQLGTFFRKVQTAFEGMPHRFDQPVEVRQPPEFGGGSSVEKISDAALRASQCLFQYYRMSRKGKPPSDVEVDKLRVAALIDCALNLSKVCKALPIVEVTEARLKQGQATAAEVRTCLRETGIYLEYLANYEDRREESILL